MKLFRFTHLHTIVALGIFAVLCATLFFPLPAFGFLGDVGKEIGVFILQMIGLLTWLGGVIMNFAVERLVVGMGAQISGGGFGISIELAWIVVRDLMNIFFVFGLVFVGMALILNIQKYDLKKQLAFIIIGALLVNFSLFFAKFVIDVANVTATEIYEELIFAEDPLQKRVDVGISGQFMGAMGLVGLFDEGTSQIRGDAFTGSLSFMIAGAFFLLVAAFVFAAAGILIIIRFIVLVFLMIFSPIAFGALAFPQTQKYALQWWKMLFSQAFFAPALLFLLYISLQVVNGTIGANTNSASFAEALSGSEIDIIIAFFLATGFLIGSLIIAKQIGAYGANASTAAAARFSFGAMGAAGRNTFGRLAHKGANNDELLTKASQGGLSGWAARRRLGLYRAGAAASYDVRSVAEKTGVDKKMEKMGVSLGKRYKGGFEQRQKDIAKKETEFAKSLGKDETAINATKKEQEGELAERDEQLAEKRAAKENKQRELDNTEAAKRSEIKPLLERQHSANLRANDNNLSKNQREAAERDAKQFGTRIAQVNDRYEDTISSLNKEVSRMENEAKAFEEETKKVKKGHDETLTNLGKKRQTNYADKLEGDGFSAALPGVVRSPAENRSAASAVRKEFNKSKEEQQTEKIVDAVKTSQSDKEPKES